MLQALDEQKSLLERILTSEPTPRIEKLREMYHNLDDWRIATGAPVPIERNPEYDPKEERKAIQLEIQKSRKDRK